MPRQRGRYVIAVDAGVVVVGEPGFASVQPAYRLGRVKPANQAEAPAPPRASLEPELVLVGLAPPQMRSLY